VLIEQAIFTSTCSDRTAGYQLVARSPGIGDADARELTVWGPSHDSLETARGEPQSVNYHPLPSGAHCVSRSVLAGQEYSQRRGDLVHTHCLLVDDVAMRRFAHNPFNLLRAATALGALTNSPPSDSRLEPFRLVGRSAQFDADAVSLAIATLPTCAVPRLIDAVLTHEAIGVCVDGDFRALIAAFLQCLPVECRSEISFATGLKPSAQRPYRLITLGRQDESGKRQVVRRYGLDVVDLNQAADAPLRNAWARYVAEILDSSDWSHLERHVATTENGATQDAPVDLSGLDRLGRLLLADYAASAIDDEASDTDADDTPAVVSFTTRDSDTDGRDDDAPRTDAKRRARARWVAPIAADTVVTEMIADPAQVIGRQRPDILEELEQLDDMVFEAIAGKRAAIESLRALWPRLVTNLPQGLLDESRCQYLRHALSMWRDCVEGEEIREPGRAIAALDVVDVLFEQDLSPTAE
jgi:hypothetical protein